MARQPRRMRTYITRSEIIAGIAFAVVLIWLALMAISIGA